MGESWPDPRVRLQNGLLFLRHDLQHPYEVCPQAACGAPRDQEHETPQKDPARLSRHQGPRFFGKVRMLLVAFPILISAFFVSATSRIQLWLNWSTYGKRRTMEALDNSANFLLNVTFARGDSENDKDLAFEGE